MNALDMVGYLARSLSEAEYRLGLDVGAGSGCEVSAWMQGWGSTACGHRGVGGQALTTGFVVSVIDVRGRILIFSQGRLLHDVPWSEAVVGAIYRQCVPPAGGVFAGT